MQSATVCSGEDAPRKYGPHKTQYNRFIRSRRLRVFDRLFANLAGKGPNLNAS